MTARGAYGLRLSGLASVGELLVAAPAEWPEWRIDRSVAPARDVVESVGARHARLSLAGGGYVDLDLDARRSLLVTPDTIGAEAAVHPYLSSSAVVTARWFERQCFHAGAFAETGRAWAVLGDKGAGKSTLLGCLAQSGVTILSDDVLVIDDGQALAGPRCIDLRAEAAPLFAAAVGLGKVGARERWRLAVGDAPAQMPLGGWCVLEWADTPSVGRVPPAERIPLLFDALALRQAPLDPGEILALAALPMFRLRRPPRLDGLAGAAELLLDALSAVAAR